MPLPLAFLLPALWALAHAAPQFLDQAPAFGSSAQSAPVSSSWGTTARDKSPGTSSATVDVGSPGSAGVRLSPPQTATGPGLHKAMIYGCVTPNTVAFTFDDGPHIYTEELLQLLDQEKVKATFFLNGNNYQDITQPEWSKVVQDIHARGHQIGEHTVHHLNLTALSEDQIRDEVTVLDAQLKKILNVRPRYFRPPFGEVNDDVLRIVQDELGFTVVLWDIESDDTEHGGDTQLDFSAYTTALDAPDAAHQGYIVLNHDTIETTVRVLAKEAIDYVRSKGFKTATVAECMGDAGNEYRA